MGCGSHNKDAEKMKTASISRVLQVISLPIAICLFNSIAQAQYSSGTGVADDPYQIATVGDLMRLGDSPEDYDKHFILIANIDLDLNLTGGKVFSKAVIAPDMDQTNYQFDGPAFTGIFNGNAHTISHLAIEGKHYLGLFGKLGLGAEVKNLGVLEVSIEGSGICIGGLAAVNSGSIATSYSTGRISGGTQVGGLVGESNFPSIIKTSYSTATVNGEIRCGGIVGYNGGSIAMSYSTGSVTGNLIIGGLVGNNVGGDLGNGIITSSYSTGVVNGIIDVGGLVGRFQGGSIAESFWDIETSGQSSSAGGIGLTTAEMQTALTFLNAGWDFINETENGTDDIWKITEGFYPHLSWEKYSGGTGEVNDPYLIYTAENLNTIGTEPNDWDKHFKLMVDIDLSAYNGTSINLIGSYDSDWNEKSFTGVFKGNGHVISGFTYHGDSLANAFFVGLFRSVDGVNAKIQDLRLIDPNVGGGRYIGALVGRLHNGMISNCVIEKGRVIDPEGSDIGGIVGMNIQGILSNCRAEHCVVQGRSRVGGLVGKNEGTIQNCYSSGEIFGNLIIGGLVGNNSGNILNTRSTSIVTGLGSLQWAIGGLIGLNIGTIQACYSTGDVTGIERVGGLVGNNNDDSVITDSYATGNVSGDSRIGGLVGHDDGGTISNSYAEGSIDGNDLVGGLVGDSNNTSVTSASFWNVETSGQTTSASGTGKTTAEMQMASTFLEAGWDFVYETANGIENIWNITEGLSYPHLWWEKYGGGMGESNNPYLIYTAEHLNAIGTEPNDWDKHFKLMADIDLSAYTGNDFNIIGYWRDWNNNKPFIGTFNGNGHIISNFTYDCNGADHIGLFGNVGYADGSVNPQIRVLTLINPNINAGTGNNIGPLVGKHTDGNITGCHVEGGHISGGSDVGGLVGRNQWGTITNCHSSADVSGGNNVAGIAGRNYGGTIANCFSTDNATGDSSIGGLVGWQMFGAEIIDCYATGNITGNKYVGGLVGSNLRREYGISTITNCYSVGRVTGSEYIGGLVGFNLGSAEFSFWDLETSIQSSSAAGVGKTTVEMQMASTFLEAGWDFLDEAANGTDDIWWIDEGKDYPKLWWELIQEN